MGSFVSGFLIYWIISWHPNFFSVFGGAPLSGDGGWRGNLCGQLATARRTLCARGRVCGEGWMVLLLLLRSCCCCIIDKCLQIIMLHIQQWQQQHGAHPGENAPPNPLLHSGPRGAIFLCFGTWWKPAHSCYTLLILNTLTGYHFENNDLKTSNKSSLFRKTLM